ncbi:putative nuclease HARBI1 isoform X1 [Ixodes scapularis]
MCHSKKGLADTITLPVLPGHYTLVWLQGQDLFPLKDTRLREAGAEAVYCLARGAPKGPNIPRAQLNHQGPLFPGHGYATHSQTWVGEPTWLGVRSDATHQAPTKVGAPCVRVWWPTWLGSVVTLLTKHLAPKVQAPPAGLGVRGDATLQTPAFTERLYREHRDAFELPEEIFRKQYRLPKIVVRWLCDELREEPEVRRVRTSWTVMTVELQVLCALRFYGTGSFQGMVASDEHVARDQKTVSVAVRAVSVAIVRRLGVQRGWIHFPETPSERFDAEKGFRLLGRIPGVIGCVDGTMVSIVGPSKNDPTVTKAAYWCRKYFYALNVMVVCDADCRIMCIDPRYPGSVHDSFVWQFSWLRNQLEQGQLPRDGRFLLGDSGYPLEPWLITPVPGNHATSTACGRFNKAHSSISAPQHLPCIERARTGVRLRP